VPFVRDVSKPGLSSFEPSAKEEQPFESDEVEGLPGLLAEAGSFGDLVTRANG